MKKLNLWIIFIISVVVFLVPGPLKLDKISYWVLTIVGLIGIIFSLYHLKKLSKLEEPKKEEKKNDE